MNIERWHALMLELGFSENLSTWKALVQAYSETHRHYHTATHINACLAHLESAATLAEHPAEIALALWFHDAVYRPRKTNNEQKSAEWASEFLISNGATKDAVQRVHALIMATLHNAAVNTHDEALMVDIDLSNSR